MDLRRRTSAVRRAGPPALTRDPADDPIVYDAQLADADYLNSDDRIVGPGDEPVLEHADHGTLAMTFGRFITDYVSPPDFAWDGVERAWIDEAQRASSGGGLSASHMFAILPD